MDQKLGATVILYNPTPSHVLNIHTYLEKFEKVWVIDNSEDDLLDLTAIFKDLQNVEIIQDGVNKGIGKALNIAIRNANTSKCSWLLTMDQDSFFEKNEIDKYVGTIKQMDQNTDIALMGVNIERRQHGDNKTDLSEVPYVITSGTFINLHAQSMIGEMKEDLFIDEIDTEYSFRSKLKGWKVVLCRSVFMDHTIGKIIKGISLKNGKLTDRYIHVPARLYYMTRNYLWVRSVYKKNFPDIFKERTKQLFMIYKNNIFYNPDRSACLLMIFRGWRDFRRNKFGKIQ